MKTDDAPPPRAMAEANHSNLTVGKTETGLGPMPTELHKQVSDRYLQHRAASVKEKVSGDVALHEGIAALGDDHESLQKLLAALVDAKVLSQAEALTGLGGSKSTMSMLRKTAEYAHVILHPKILPLLQPGYSVLYQVACLFEDLEAINGHD